MVKKVPEIAKAMAVDVAIGFTYNHRGKPYC